MQQSLLGVCRSLCYGPQDELRQTPRHCKALSTATSLTSGVREVAVDYASQLEG